MKSIAHFRTAVLATLILLVAVPLASEAQVRVRRGHARARRWYRAAPVRIGLGLALSGYGGFRYGGTYGYGSPYGYGRTYEGDQLRGMAQIIRAQGAAQRSQSEAAINYQQAQKAYIANQKAWNEVYRERVQMARERRERERLKREELREKLRAGRAKRATESTTPRVRPRERLSASQLDPYTGKLNWPSALLFADGIELRQQIEELFRLRIHSGGTNDLNRRLREKTRALEKLFKKRIRSIPSSDYFAAKSFLELLVNETVYLAD